MKIGETRSYVFGNAPEKALLQGLDATANFALLLSRPFTPTVVRERVAVRGTVAEAGRLDYNR